LAYIDFESNIGIWGKDFSDRDPKPKAVHIEEQRNEDFEIEDIPEDFFSQDKI
jgi:hypothetical protein